MSNKLMAILLAFCVVIFAGLIIYNILNQENITQINVSDEVMKTFRDNCARCHGQAGEGFEEFPALTDNGLAIEEIKTIIRGGQKTMPPFSNIPDPLLTDLAKYISNL